MFNYISECSLCFYYRVHKNAEMKKQKKQKKQNSYSFSLDTSGGGLKIRLFTVLYFLVFLIRSLNARRESRENWALAQNGRLDSTPACFALAFSFACVNREAVNSLHKDNSHLFTFYCMNKREGKSQIADV